jgi:phage gp29-like protein
MATTPAQPMNATPSTEHEFASEHEFAPTRQVQRIKFPDALTVEQADRMALFWMSRLPDPDVVLRKAGIDRTALRNLEGDDEISQCLETRREAVVTTPWRLEPDATSDAAQHLIGQLRPHIETIIRSAFGAVPYGYSVIECLFEQRGGRCYLTGVFDRPFEWFTPRNDGLTYHGSHGDIDGDPEKYYLTVRGPTTRNPYGEALLSRLYWPAFIRREGWNHWLQFLERFGTPMIFGKTRGNPTQAAQMLYDAARRNASLAVGVDEDIVMLDSGKDGRQFEMMEQAIVRRIEKTILGQTLTSDTGKDGGGSYALGKVHEQVRQDKRNADIRLVSKTVQRIINTLCKYSGWQPFEYVMADEVGLETERVDRDVKVVRDLGFDVTEGYLLDRLDFRPGDLVKRATPALAPIPPAAQNEPAAAAQAAAQPIALANFAEPDQPRFTTQQQVIEDGIEGAIDALASPLNSPQIAQAIRAATSPEDLEERLAILLRTQDPRTFHRIFERALFAADVLGYAHAGPGESSQTQAPTLNLHAAIHLPETALQPAPITLSPQAVQVDVHLPEQPAPTVHVAAAAPTVQVLAPEQPAPIVNVNLPNRRSETTVERDARGDIVKTIRIETNTEQTGTEEPDHD